MKNKCLLITLFFASRTFILVSTHKFLGIRNEQKIQIKAFDASKLIIKKKFAYNINYVVYAPRLLGLTKFAAIQDDNH